MSSNTPTFSVVFATLLAASASCPARTESVGGWRFELPASYQRKGAAAHEGAWLCQVFASKSKSTALPPLNVCTGSVTEDDSSDGKIADRSGLGWEDENWYGYGYLEKKPAEEIERDGNGSGFQAETTCGFVDRVGQHAAGGICYQGFVRDSTQMVLTIEVQAFPLEKWSRASKWVRRILARARRD